jgi:hypothetical protein
MITMWNGPDQYGIPGNTFGHVPEEFYGVVGRVVMLSALIENKYTDLATKLDGTAEAIHAGKSIGQLEKEFKRIDSDRAPSPRRIEVLAEMKLVLEKRNAIVHSLWPSPTLGSASGWRAITPKKRGADGECIGWVEHTIETLEALIRELVEVNAALRELFDEPDVSR